MIACLQLANNSRVVHVAACFSFTAATTTLRTNEDPGRPSLAKCISPKRDAVGYIGDMIQFSSNRQKSCNLFLLPESSNRRLLCLTSRACASVGTTATSCMPYQAMPVQKKAITRAM
ncbi:hypothetical protein EDC01DRAFT_668172 [Geopyxis carbonaria]|nr:hypothetical protein EDC01DRAFT_668172 [Geopyxis carbonaria]